MSAMMVARRRPVVAEIKAERCWSVGGRFNFEFDLGAFRQVLAANVLHVEENVLVRVLG